MRDYIEGSRLVSDLLRPSAPDSSAAAPALVGAKEAENVLLRPSAPDSSAAAPALAGAKEASGTEGAGSTAPSCAGGLDCGGVSCCKSIALPGGTYQMGRSTVSGASDHDAAGTSDYASAGSDDELPEHPATVAGFSLDKYEVTVGRFRKFVEQYTGRAPAVGAGAHPLIAGTGWQRAWNESLPASQAALKTNLACSSTYQTWTDAVSGKELPIGLNIPPTYPGGGNRTGRRSPAYLD